MRCIALLAVVLGLSACGHGRPEARGVDHDETLLTVTASGRADTRPDEAHLQIGVQSQAASAGDASRLNRDKMARVTEALAKLGVKPDDLQTRNLTLSRLDYGRERGQFRAYNVIDVKMREMGKVGDAVTAVTEAGANVMSGPDLQVSDREAASKSAYAAAYRAARSRAEAYAGAADLKIGRVLAIRDGGDSSAIVAESAAYAVDMSARYEPGVVAQASPAPFSPGQNTTVVQVRVDFALER